MQNDDCVFLRLMTYQSVKRFRYDYNAPDLWWRSDVSYLVIADVVCLISVQLTFSDPKYLLTHLKNICLWYAFQNDIFEV